MLAAAAVASGTVGAAVCSLQDNSTRVPASGSACSVKPMWDPAHVTFGRKSFQHSRVR
jgi:hypothetical protein